MFQTLWEAVHKESIGIVLGATAALVTTWYAAYRRRRREMSEINQGKQFQQLEFAYAFVSNNANGQRRLAVRMIGCLPLKTFVAKDAIREHLLGLSRDSAADELNSVIPMDGKLGSFVLRELHGHLRTLVRETGDRREWWVMVPILETYRPLHYVAPTVLLIRKADLAIFRSFESCRDLLVHHGSDAAKILTLIEVSRKFDAQRERLARAQATGGSTQYLEEMWLLDLCLPTDVIEPTPHEVATGTLKPFRPAPWDRFSATLATLNLAPQLNPHSSKIEGHDETSSVDDSEWQPKIVRHEAPRAILQTLSHGVRSHSSIDAAGVVARRLPVD